MNGLVLIPAYNESESIYNLIDTIKKKLPDFDILVINDCSTDDTWKVLNSISGIEVINLPFNMGIGSAVLTGFLYFVDEDYDLLIRIDADGQHPPEEAKKLINEIVSGSADIAIGSRYLEKERKYSSFLRMLGIKLLTHLSSLILKIKLTDSTSGFRAYNRKAVEFLVKDYPFDYPEPEEVYMLTRNGFKIKEVPVIMNERKTGKSSITTAGTYYYLIKILLAILIKHLVGGKYE